MAECDWDHPEARVAVERARQKLREAMDRAVAELEQLRARVEVLELECMYEDKPKP
jgi:hypothetical protein